METPIFRLGVSGHQNLGDLSTTNFVTQHVRQLLITYREHYQTLVLYAALAKGADQLFVRTALDLGIPVEAVLPCAEYEQTFLTDEARKEYHRLLRLCQHIHILPMQECSDEAFLAAGEWIVDQCDLLILAWNGFPPQGRGGTGDVAAYARFVQRPFIQINTEKRMVTSHGDAFPSGKRPPLNLLTHEAACEKYTVYQGQTLVVNQYRFLLPDEQEIVRDIVERPESVLIVPVGKPGLILLIEEYDLGAEVWQLTLPGGKVEQATPEGLLLQAHLELRQETGYKAARMEKLVDFYSHPGYVAHHVHVFVAHDLVWDPLEKDAQEAIRVRVYPLQEALDATLMDYRCDPEAALALWLYARRAGLL